MKVDLFDLCSQHSQAHCRGDRPSTQTWEIRVGQGERQCESHWDQRHGHTKCGCFAEGGQERGATRLESNRCSESSAFWVRRGVWLAMCGDDPPQSVTDWPEWWRQWRQAPLRFLSWYESRPDCITGPEWIKRFLLCVSHTEFILPFCRAGNSFTGAGEPIWTEMFLFVFSVSLCPNYFLGLLLWLNSSKRKKKKHWKTS